MDDKIKTCLMAAAIAGNFTVVGGVLFGVWYLYSFLIGLAVFGVVFAGMYAAT
jgi:hypothetical protein